MNAQFVEKKNGLIVRPTVGINYSKNDYRMKNVQMRDESGDNFIYGNPKRFHDGYFSLLAQVEAGFVNKSWADAFFVSASYSKQTRNCRRGLFKTKYTEWQKGIPIPGTSLPAIRSTTSS